MANVGRLSVEVTADTTKLAAQIQAASLASASRAGVSAGTGFGQTFSRSANLAVTSGAAKMTSQLTISGGKAGAGAGGAFAGTFQGGVATATAGMQAQITGAGARAGAAGGKAAGTSFAKTFKTAALVGVGAIATLGIGALVKQGLEVASANESAAVSFEVMLGSAEKAQAFLKELQQFAAATPFEFPELRDSASRLIALGVETSRIVPIMTTLGDATAGMGTGAAGIERAMIAVQQMANQGRVQVGELNQMAQAGVPIWDMLGAQLKKTPAEVRQAVEQNAVGIEDVYAALEAGGGKMMDTLSGTMEKQSQTLQGLISTLKDEINLALGDVAAPLVQDIKSILPELATALGGVVQGLGPAFASIGDMVKSLAPVLAPLGKVFATLVEQVTRVAAVVLDGLAPAFQALAGPVSDLLRTLGTALTGLLGPVSQVLGQVIGILARFVSILADALQPALAVWPALMAEVASALRPFLQVLAQVATILADGFARAIADVMPVIRELVAAFTSGMKGMGPAITEVAKAMVPLAQEIARIMPLLAQMAKDLLPLLVPLLQSLGQAFASGLAMYIRYVVAAMTAMVAVFRELITWGLEFRARVAEAFQQVLTVVLGTVEGIVTALDTAFGGLPVVGDTFRTMASNVAEWRGTTVTALGGIASSSRNTATAIGTVNGTMEDGTYAAGLYSAGLSTVHDSFQRTSAIFGYKDAVDAVNKAFKDQVKSLSINNKAGRDLVTTLTGMAQATKTQMDGTNSLAQRVNYAKGSLDQLGRSLKGTKMDPRTAQALYGPFQQLIDELDTAGVDVSTLQAQLDRMKSKTIRITIDSNWSELDPAERSALLRARGGIVRGPGTATSDSIPVWVSNGEYVVQASAVRKFGEGFFDALNAGMMPQTVNAAYKPPVEAVASVKGGGNTYITNITNPEPERASESLPAALRRASFAASWSAA